MKRKRNIIISIMIFLSTSILILICLYEKQNINYTYKVEYKNDKPLNSTIYFSVEPGFYDQPFYLEILAPTDEIYYTLDGSDPNKHSLRYVDPIFISDATSNENVHSSRTDTSPLFVNELENKYSNYTEYSTDTYDNTYQSYDYIPDYKIDKATIIKAIYYDENDEKSNIECGTYFVGFNNKTGYNNINVVSIVTDPYNLFDYKDGIYVLGDTFDKFIEEKKYEMTEYRHWWSGNYTMKGKEWERSSNIQFFDSKGRLVLSQRCGIRIQGAKSRGYPMKSFNLYAREEYDGNSKLNYDFFGNGYIPDTVTLHAGGSDHKSKFKNPLISNISNNLNFSTMIYIPYVLFLDGEYWGFYYLTEKYNAAYISFKYDVSESDVLMIKNSLVECGNEEDIDYFYETVNFATHADMTVEENYEKVCQLFDIDSFIDYFATEIYIANDDFSFENNCALWRTKSTSSSNEYADGKWRWMLFDVDVTSAEDMVSVDSIDHVAEDFPIFVNLCTNDSFRTQFSKRILEIGKNEFAADKVDKIVTDYLEFMNNPMEVYFKRFWGTSNMEMYEEVYNTKYFFHKRYKYIEQILERKTLS